MTLPSLTLAPSASADIAAASEGGGLRLLLVEVLEQDGSPSKFPAMSALPSIVELFSEFDIMSVYWAQQAHAGEKIKFSYNQFFIGALATEICKNAHIIFIVSVCPYVKTQEMLNGYS